MALSAADSGSNAGSMDAEARMGREESRKRCGESSLQLASRAPWYREFALYPVSYSRSGYLIILRCPNKIRILALAIFCVMPMAARIVIDSKD
jgi:hypothetical protein